MMTEPTQVICKALGHETRWKLLRQLIDGGKTTSQLAEQLQLSQPTLHHHLQLLLQADLIHNCSWRNPKVYDLDGDTLNRTLFQLLVNDPDHQSLSDMRAYQRKKNYLDSYTNEEGKLYFDSYLMDRPVLEQALPLLEPEKIYFRKELIDLFSPMYVKPEDVVVGLLRLHYLEKTRPVVQKQLGSSSEEVFQLNQYPLFKPYLF